MTKWICNREHEKCEFPCFVEINSNQVIPKRCVFVPSRAAKWERVPDEPEQKTENTLPDWCKVGEWVYAICYFSGESDYYKIREIKPGADTILEIEGHGADYLVFGNHIKQARLRPYNAEELKALVGKVVSTKRDCGIITGYRGEDNKVFVAWENIRYSADALLGVGATIDGHPCGVFEHLEDGEWVE